MRSNRKGQVGETVTWIVATVVIIVVLIFYIFGASMLGTTKDVGGIKDSVFSRSQSFGENIFLKKSIYSYLLLSSENVKKKIDIYLTDEDEEAYKENLKLIRDNYNKRL